MKILVMLAAGTGSRLHPDTATIPKALLPVGGHLIIDRLLAAFGDWPDRVVLVTGHLAPVMAEHARTWSVPTTLRHNPLFASTNSLFSLAMARDVWTTAGEVVVTNTDVILTQEAASGITRADGELVLGLDARVVDDEDMKMTTTPSGRVARVSKEIPTADAAGEFVGVSLARGKGVEALAETLEDVLHRQELVRRGWYDLVLDEMSVRGFDLIAHGLPPGSYVEVDTHEDLHEARRQFELEPLTPEGSCSRGGL